MENNNETITEIKNGKNKNVVIMKILVFLGVAILFFITTYTMYHFFVEKSNIKINMSTDKKLEYLTINGQRKMIMSQNYISDLSYSMRYDIESFKIFKYKGQDFFKNLNDERILVVIEKATTPSNCSTITTNTEFNECYIKVDNYTEEYYYSANNKVYKITVKTPGFQSVDEDTKARINHMLESFVMTN